MRALGEEAAVVPADLYTPRQVAAMMPRIGGRAVDPRTVWRWMRVGVRGVKLAYEHVGGRRVVRGESVLAFHRAIQRRPESDPLSPTDSANLEMRRAVARERLRHYGFFD